MLHWTELRCTLRAVLHPYWSLLHTELLYTASYWAMLHPNWAKHCTLKGIERPLQQRGESRLTRSLLINWRLGNFLSYFTRPSSQDHQKPIKRRLITFLCDFDWSKSLSTDFFDSGRWICKLSHKQIYLEDYSCALHFKKRWLWPKKGEVFFIWSALSDSTVSEYAGIKEVLRREIQGLKV